MEADSLMSSPTIYQLCTAPINDRLHESGKVEFKWRKNVSYVRLPIHHIIPHIVHCEFGAQ